jgi:PAS domain S-box-containing protein
MARRTNARDEKKHARESKPPRKRKAEPKPLSTQRDPARKKFTFHKASIEDLIENLPEAIALLDQHDRVMRINREFSRVFGYTLDEALGRPIDDLIVPPDLREEGARFFQVVTDGSTLDADTVRRRKDGSLIPVSVLAILIHGEDDTRQICAIYRDIADRKEAEEKLRRRDGILEALARATRSFLEEAPIAKGIQRMLEQLGLATEVSRVYVFVNHTAEDGSLLTSERYEWVAPGITRQMHNPDNQGLPCLAGEMERWVEILRRGHIVQGHVRDFPESEQEILVPQGILSILAVPIFVGQEWWGFVGFDECARERAWTAAETDALKAAAGTLGALIQRQRVQEALRESEERFRSVFENSPDAICVIDDPGCCVLVNDAMCRLIGVSRAGLVGSHYGTYVDEETLAIMETNWAQRKRGGPAPLSYECEVIRPDGGVRTTEIVPAILRPPSGPPLRLVILRDVTDYRRMQDQLEAMRSRLLELQEMERAAVARVLHDTIGQNLGILAFNVTAIEQMIGEAGSRQIATLIANMRTVIEETGDKLRDVARGLHPREVRELGLVVGVRALINQFVQRTGLQVTTSIDGDGLKAEEKVAINTYRIIQEAFTNIIKHSHCRSVDFQLHHDGNRLLVSIKDDGVGFCVDEVRGREIGRRGMGMFIIHERTRAINGRLEVCSTPNQGTRVLLTVPLMT